MPETGAIGFLQRQRPARFVSTEDVPQNVVAMNFGLYETRGYDLPIIRRYDHFWRTQVMPGTGSVAGGFLDIPLRFMGVTPRSLRAIRLVGVRDILGPKTVWPPHPPFDRLLPAPPLHQRGLTLVYDGPDARVYRVTGAWPRAFVVRAQRVVHGGAAALEAIMRPAFDARRVVITEQRLPGVPDELAAGGRRIPKAGARITRYGAEGVVIRARSPRRGGPRADRQPLPRVEGHGRRTPRPDHAGGSVP